MDRTRSFGLHFRRTDSNSFLRIAAAAALVAGWLTMLTNSADAVNVTNYSWLQLPPADVTPFLGSTNSATGSSHGEPADFRWGDYVWLPSTAMTASGTQMYYAGVRLDQSRPVSSVRLQWWTTAAHTLSEYYIDGSNNGTSWTNLANPAGPPLGLAEIVTIPVTPGSYEYIRVRMEPGDYTGTIPNYNGPGLLLIEPFGSGAVNSDQVNWANGPNFGTTVTNYGTSALGLNYYNSTTHNSGSLQDQSGLAYWTGSIGNWPAGEYTQVDLGTPRLVSSATGVWAQPYTGSDFELQYSMDGTNFFSVPNRQAATQYGNASSYNGATRVQFDPTIARYIRMTDAVQYTTGYTLLNQMLVHGPTDGVLATDPVANDTISTPFRTLGETVTLNGAIELENIGTLGSSVGILSFTITGPDALQFDLTNFAPTILASGNSVLFNLEFMSLASQNYNAVLTFNTSLGDVVFNLQANMVPEPSTLSLFGFGLIGLALRRRRRRTV